MPEVDEPRSGFTTNRSTKLIKSTESRIEYKPILPILMFLKGNWIFKEKLVVWTETSKMDSLMSGGSKVELGGHQESWFYARPHQDGT